MKKILTFISMAFWFAVGCTAKDVLITECGAKVGKNKISTEAIQKAIDLCHKSGGGKVIVPKGKFASGAIVLKNGVKLHLEEGAVLYGSKRPADYVLNKDRKDIIWTTQLIFAQGAKNIGITGSGVIDGRGAGFTDQACNAVGVTRPMLIRFDSCRDIIVSGVTLRNSAVWMQHYYACDNLVIKGITVDDFCNNCNDGIDITCCNNVTISDCLIESDDDGICLKTTSLRPCQNVTVTNCTVSTHCNALKIGLESLGDFSNITFRNCRVRPSNKKVFNGLASGISAIAVESVDGGNIRNVVFDQIDVVGTEAPIFVRLGDCGNTYDQKVPKRRKGTLSGVSISNVTVTGAGNTGCSITGLPGQHVEDVKLSNISITHKGGMGRVMAPRDNKAADYPEGTMWGILPAKGFFVKNARGVSFDKVKIISTKNDERPPVYRENVE